MRRICNECRIGRMEVVEMPYFFALSGRPLIVPHVPALLCDVCGQVRYDLEIIRNVQSLLDQGVSGSKPAHHQMIVASSYVWQRVRRSV